MKLYKTIITPLSSFGTTLKGDTIFGHICWALCFLKGEDGLSKLLYDYENTPFLVVSDAFASGYLPKPTAPSAMLGEDLSQKKQNRKKIWLSMENLKNGEFNLAKTNEEARNSKISSLSIKNSINRLTFGTDEGDFAPFSLLENALSKQDIYFLIDESKISIDELRGAFLFVSKMGYGKKSSIGKGRFEVGDFDEITDFLDSSANAFITLSASVLNGFKESYYEPFTRFGKHGASLANDKPFKKPILLADTSALLVPNDEQKTKILELGYIGKGIKNHSAHENSVHQGYAITLSTKVVK